MYYFSGTGNALNAARWMREEASSRGIDITLEPVDRFDARRVPRPGPAPPVFHRISLCHACFSLPFTCFDSYWVSPAWGRAPVFLVNTSGGTKVGRFHLPAFPASLLVLPALVLACKGYRGGSSP